MNIVTFLFVCIEIVILFYLIIYRLARPDNKTTWLNIVLIILLILYNVTGGLLPDENLPGSYFVQTSIAYATGFITPCYFPYYVYKAFALERMKFHAQKGVFIFLILPYIIFVIVFASSGRLDNAKNLLVLPVLYALWVIISLMKAIRYKYRNSFESRESKEEIAVLFLSLTPWIGLPIIDFFNLGQAAEASITNIGFLLLLALQVKKHIKEIRIEHQRLIDSEKRLLNWNTSLKTEVDKRTKELEMINEQKTNTLVNLAHETKTPLTLINNYLEEYISRNENSEELTVVKRSIDKLSTDIENLFDLEKFSMGFAVYDHSLITNFSEILSDSMILFKQYALKKRIEINEKIETGIFIKADPLSINRIINNLVGNAIKYSSEASGIDVTLNRENERIIFGVYDNGPGIPGEMQSKVFEPYFQITSQKRNTQGMGLGLPIVKKVIEDLNGKIKITSDPAIKPGTKVIVELNRYAISADEQVTTINISKTVYASKDEEINYQTVSFKKNKPFILVVEDNLTMLNYLVKKLLTKYNVIGALNGVDAIKKLKEGNQLPDLIISDVMMDKMDGLALAKIISQSAAYSHIPFIFLTAKSGQADKLVGLKNGAIDYMQKPFSIYELMRKTESILTVSEKQKAIAVNGTIAHNPNPVNGNFDENCKLYGLTSREKEIARLICNGSPYKIVADILCIAEKTVAKHLQNIFEKVNVSSKIELVNRLEFQ